MFQSKFSSIFEIQEIDPHGKKFDRVSRIIATSELNQLTLDVNTEIYPLAANERLTLVLVTVEDSESTGFMDDYDYVMHGKIYKYEDNGNDRVSVYASYGGLLMCLAGDQRQLQTLKTGSYIYLLLRK